MQRWRAERRSLDDEFAFGGWLKVERSVIAWLIVLILAISAIKSAVDIGDQSNRGNIERSGGGGHEYTESDLRSAHSGLCSG